MDPVTKFLNKVEKDVVHQGQVTFNQGPVTFKWDMDVLILHQELPEYRSCQQESLDTEKCMNKKRCITCNAYLNNRQYAVSVQVLGVAKFVADYLRRHAEKYRALGPREQIAEMFKALAEVPQKSRKELSHYGAVRVPKSRLLGALQSNESMNNYWIQMIMSESGPAYRVYKDYGNYAMAAWCKQENFVEVQHLNDENKGDFVECVLAMGYFYRSTPKEGIQGLDMIPDMVVYIESGLDKFSMSHGDESQGGASRGARKEPGRDYGRAAGHDEAIARECQERDAYRYAGY